MEGESWRHCVGHDYIIIVSVPLIERGFPQTRQDIVFPSAPKDYCRPLKSAQLGSAAPSAYFPSDFSFMQLEIVGLRLDIINHKVILILDLLGSRINYNTNLQGSFA